MSRRVLSFILAVLTLLPLFGILPLPTFAKDFTLTRFFTGDTSDWETWGGTTSLVLRANGVNADKIARDIDQKTEQYRWFLSFNGGESLRIDPATYVLHGSNAITLRFPTYARGFSPSYNPAGASDNGIYYDLDLRVEDPAGKTVYTASVKNLHSTLTDPVIADTVTLDGSKGGNGFGQSLPSGKKTTALLFTVKDGLSKSLWEDRADYRWHLVYEDKKGRAEQDLLPSAFDGSTLFYFEPCLGAPSFIPQKDHTYFVTLELWKDDKLCYFAGGTIYGYQMDHTAIYSDKSYKITWQVDSKKLTSTVFEGAMPFYPEATPQKEHPVKGMRYVFAGWEPKVVPASKNATYKAVFVEEKTPFELTFKVGQKEFTHVGYSGDPTVYPYTFEEQSSGGLYTLFGGFDKTPSTVAGNASYKATLLEGVKREDFDLLTLTRAELTSGGRALIGLFAADPLSKACFLPTYDTARFRLEEVTFADGVEGTFKEGVITLSLKEKKSGVLCTLLFSCKEGAKGGCAVDLLPALYDQKARPLSVESGYLQITSDLPADTDENGVLEKKDAEGYLAALKKTTDPAKAGVDDCLPDGVLSITDLTALLNRLSGIPVSLYRGAEDEHTLLYTVTEGGKIAGQASQTVKSGETPLAVTHRPLSHCYTFLGWSDGFGGDIRTDGGMVDDLTITAVYQRTVPELTLPILRIDTGGNAISSTSTYISARVTAENCPEEYAFKNQRANVRGRGNTSWSFQDKPPYKLNFIKDVSLFGIGEADKDWLLLSTYTDKSFLRNYSMFRLGQMLEGIEYAPACTFIELYIGDDYKGVYLLTEQIEACSARLDLNDGGKEPDKDYLIELDSRAEQDGLTYFTIPNGQKPFSVKSTVYTTKETQYIAKEVSKLNSALLSGNEEQIRKLCNMESLVDNYILQELSHNRDAGFASFFFYRRDGVFYFGPPWDFDLALGNDREYGNALKEIYSKDGRGNNWFASLYKQEWFRALVAKRLEEIEPILNTLNGELLMMGKALEEPARRNFNRFRILGTPIFLEPSEVHSLKTYYEQVEYLADWISQRGDFLKKTFPLPKNNEDKE